MQHLAVEHAEAAVKKRFHLGADTGYIVGARKHYPVSGDHGSLYLRVIILDNTGADLLAGAAAGAGFDSERAQFKQRNRRRLLRARRRSRAASRRPVQPFAPVGLPFIATMFMGYSL